MGRDRLVAETITHVTRDALGHPPRVHEDQRGPVLSDERGQPVVVLLPDLVGHHRLERRAGELQVEVHRAPMALVHNADLRLRMADSN
jgi:hypothetical protein